MAITKVGTRYRGEKFDRVNDSLGSSVDGTNSGITLLTSGEALNTAVINFGNITAQGNWEKTGSGGALTFTNGINQESGGSGNTQMPYLDLQNSSYLGSGNYASETKWTLRWKQTWASSPDNYGTPFMVLSSTTGYQSASQNYIGIRFDGSSITAGGETSSAVDGASSSTGVSTSYTSTTYYMELVRDGSNIYVRNYTSSAYDTIAQESSAISIGSGTYNLRYIKMIPRWDTGSGDYDTTWDHIKFYNGVAFQLKQNKLGSGCYSFDGSNDYVSTTETGLDFQASDSFSVAFWFKTTDTGEAGFVSRWNTSNNGWLVLKDSGTTASFRLSSNWGGGNAIRAVATNNAFSDGDWHHLAVTYGGSGHSSIKMYVDGTAQTLNVNLTGTVGTITYGTNLAFGVKEATGSFSDKYDGELDDIGIWKRELTATEVGKLANNNDSPFTHTGDQNSYGTTSIANNSLVLDSNSGSGQTASPVAVRDLGTLGSSWCVRWSVYAPTQSESISGKNSFARFGFSDKGTYSSSEGLNVVTNKAILWNWHLGTSLLKNMTYTGGSGTNNGGQSISYADDTTWYWEMKYDGSTVTITRYNSDYSSAQATADTISVSNYTGMNYLVIGQPRDHANGTWELRFDNIKIWNNQSNATGSPDFTFEFDNNTDGGDAQLVSSLSNKVNLKANYTMDSTDLNPTLTYSNSNFGTWGETGSQVTESSNVITADIQTRTSNQASTVDLGSNLNSSKWAMRFKLDYNTITRSNTSTFYLDIGIASADHSTALSNSGVGLDFIALQHRVASDTHGWGVVAYYNSGSLDNPEDSTFTTAPSTTGGDGNGVYYVEIIRYMDGSTHKMSIELFSDSSYSTSIQKISKNIHGNSTDALRYVRVSNGTVSSGSSGNRITAIVSDIKVYDGIDTFKGCANDFSSTSDLDALSGIKSGSVFLQTDDTPKYYWYDGTSWKIDGTTAFLPSGSGLHVGGSGSSTSTFTATDYVWASSSVSTIGESRQYSAGAGNKNSFWIAGGGNAHTSRIFDGSSWSSTTALDTERRDTTAGGGSTSNAIIACGRNQSGTEISTSSKYNGTAWSSAGTVTGGAGEHVGGAGTGSSFLATGGSTRNDKCDKYDGTSWSASAVLPQTTVRSHNQAGNSSASAHTAGGNYASSFTWNGTSWSTSTNYVQGGDTTVRYPTGGGTAEHHWIMGCLDEAGGSSALDNTELWNGSTWTAKGALPTANYAGVGDGSDF